MMIARLKMVTSDAYKAQKEMNICGNDSHRSLAFHDP